MTTVDIDAVEQDLLTRVLDTLLREDFAGIRTGGRLLTHPDGDWLAFATNGAEAEIPVRPAEFLCPLRVREPLVQVDGVPRRGLTEVLDLLRGNVDAPDRAGFDDFADECAQALSTARRQDAHRSAVLARLAGAPRTGLAGSLYYDTLAAHQEHPVYPTGRVRLDLSEAELLRHAPEFHPRFALRWVAIPAEQVQARAGTLPDWWPTHEGQLLFPVHPLTAARALPAALQAIGVTATVLDEPTHLVTPTLSMRTVAVLADQATHLKLPLPTSTLGRRNKRGIKPGTLSDGAITERLLRAVLARETRFRGRILLADEQSYAQTAHEQLAFLIRRQPRESAGAESVNLAALLAPSPAAPDRLVWHQLADRYFGGEPLALLDAVLELLLDWQVTLLRYGIALESHQQNISLLLDRTGERTRVRLLLRDNDGPRLHRARLATTLGPDVTAVAGLADIDDARMLVDDEAPLLDLFTTITVHLCAAAPVFGLAAWRAARDGDTVGDAELRTGLHLIRARLDTAARHTSAADAALLRAGLLDADRLPVKAMVTAGTLLTKQRSGAVDVNKFYLRTGPNYLRGRHFTAR